MLLILAWIPRRRAIVTAALVGVFVVCFVYSVWGAYSFREFAYFATPAHGWEFAAGGLLALLLPQTGLTGGRRLTLVSWLGWSAIIGSAFVLDSSSPFPGWIAVLPVAGTLAVIAAGLPDARWSPSALIRLRPVQSIGDMSYSLYLWHFPLIVLGAAALGRALHLHESVLILLLSFGLGWLTKRLVEDPVRRWPRLQGAKPTFASAAGATALLVGVSVLPYSLLENTYTDTAKDALGAVTEVLETGADDTGSTGEASCFGALATLTPDECPNSHQPTAEYDPSFAALDNFDTWSETMSEFDPYFDSECRTIPDTSIDECTYSAGVDDAFTVAIVGDSHAGQWLPAVLTLGRENGWDVIRYRQSGCRLALDVYDSDTAHGVACRQWKEEIVPFITRSSSIDLVTTSAATSGIYVRDTWPDPADFERGFLDVWNPWLASGKKLLVMSDGPSYTGPIPACVEAYFDELSPCSRPRDEVAPLDPLVGAAAQVEHSNFGFIDTLSILCDDSTCHPVVGGLIAHKDGGHIAATFMVTATPIVAPEFRALAPEAFHP